MDKVFSKYIRLRDADKKGYVRCCTCGKKLHWKEAQCGHYITRNHLSVRFDEQNAHAQCCGCNMFGGGKPDEYAIFLLTKYGENILTSLNKRKKRKVKYKFFEYQEMIDEYTDKVIGLSI